MRYFARWMRMLGNDNQLIAWFWRAARRQYYQLMALLVSDERFVRNEYRRRIGKPLNLERPAGFNEKLAWLKLNNRQELMTYCSDKVLVRDYVSQLGYGSTLNRLYGVYKDAHDIDFESLPSPAFLKTNHGSGTNVIWNASRPFDLNRFRMEFNAALRTNYYLESREWNYKNIAPRIIAEEVITDIDELVDYRLLCFEGEVRMAFADIGTVAPDGGHAAGARRNAYDRDFHLLDLKVGRENFPPEFVEKPRNWQVMVEMAERLAQPFAFCRVDLYNIDGDIRFGEITFFPGSAGQNVEPKEWDVLMGSWINLSSSTIQRKSRS